MTNAQKSHPHSYDCLVGECEECKKDMTTPAKEWREEIQAISAFPSKFPPDIDLVVRTEHVIEIIQNLLDQHSAHLVERGNKNAVVKEYKDEGVMFVLKVEDGKTYDASMPIPKWQEVGKLEYRTPSTKL